MTNKDIQFNHSNMNLDSLFARARADQPDLVDDNFTKMVVNRLPDNPRRASHTQHYFDLIGLFVGLVVTFLVIEPAQIVSSLLSLLPNNITVSLSSMLMVSVLFSSLALAAWWKIERGERLIS